MLRRIRRELTLMMAGLAIAGGVEAQTTSETEPEPSTQVRQTMAALHEQMAACLRSDKPIAACRVEMMKNCQQQLGNDCRMMGHAAAGAHRMHPMGPAPEK